MTKKIAKAFMKIQLDYSDDWNPADFQLQLILLPSGPAWLCQVKEHKGLHRKCPIKAIKDLRKQLDKAVVSVDSDNTTCIYPSAR